MQNGSVLDRGMHWRGVEVDAFVPYLAMNYFDTFVSQSEENPYSEIDQVPLVAIACLTIAAKIREFSDDFDLKDFDPDTIREVELRIHNKLEGLTKPVTPFCFLDHFYPTFERIGGFKRRCINEIIVQAKGGKSEQVRAAKTESKTKSVQHRTGKGKGKGKAMEILATIAEDKEEYGSDDPVRYCPKKLMNFMLMWPTDDPLSVKEPVEESPRANDEPVAHVVCFVCEDNPRCSCSIG
ncbi:unnamed protein product [Lupinus luteus]|uniref:B-like cyclin n=1 Tax=Lupinus luteus TaxID=3873 RepID=A0AAV1WL46_LUPLU